jgi:AcrR family transcriptional regulator
MPQSTARRTPRTAIERGPTELQRLQKQTSHEKLLEAAYLSFAELTYAGTTIDHIVRRAEVNRSTFYRHFDSKFAIAKALFTEFWPRLFAEFDRLESASPSEAEIEEWISNLLVFYRANKPLYFTLGQIPALEPEGVRWEEDVRREVGIRLGRRIPAFRRATSPTESTPELRVRFTMTMNQFEMGVFWLAFRDQGPDRQALMNFTVGEFRRFIVEEGAGAS